MRNALHRLGGALAVLAVLSTGCGGNGLVPGRPVAATVTIYGPVPGLGIPTHPPATIGLTDPQLVQRLAAELDALPVIPPNARFSCPAAVGQHTDIEFLYTVGQPVVLRSGSCVGIGRLEPSGKVNNVRWLKGPAWNEIVALQAQARK